MYMSSKGRHAFSFHRAIKEMKPSPSKFLDKLYIVCLLTKTFFSSFSPPRICGVTGNLNLNKTELSLFSPKKPLIMGGNSKVLLNFQLRQRRQQRECSVHLGASYKDKALQKGAQAFSPFSLSTGCDREIEVGQRRTHQAVHLWVRHVVRLLGSDLEGRFRIITRIWIVITPVTISQYASVCCLCV